MPVYPNTAWKPTGGEEPTLRILTLLAATVGLPYFLLSTTGPLVQAWYARRFKGAMPYRLYALSNLGSMFALLSYPFLFEPAFATRQQATIWSWGYVAFIVLCGAAAIVSVGWGPSSNALFQGVYPLLQINMGHTSQTALQAAYDANIDIGSPITTYKGAYSTPQAKNIKPTDGVAWRVAPARSDP